MRERVVVLDFGGQYNQLIARRVREAGVYSELIPHDAPIERIKGDSLSAIIMTGGPDSAYEEGAKACDNAVFSLGVPVLGICYGMQYIAKVFGGAIASAPIREYGHTKIRFTAHPLFEGLGGVVWMNHNDSVTRAPEGFSAIAATDACPVAAFAMRALPCSSEAIKKCQG